jgi:hypothetical protein
MVKQKIGQIIFPGDMNALPEPHEIEATKIFTRKGENVEFINPSRSQKTKTPDIMLYGIAWEIKSPTGNSRWTIETQFGRAAKQSCNIILDMRRTKLPDKQTIKEAEKQFNKRRGIRRLIIITKQSKTIDFKK